jgi:hypothetical protein
MKTALITCLLILPVVQVYGQEYGLRNDTIGESIADFRAHNHNVVQVEGKPMTLPRCSGDAVQGPKPAEPTSSVGSPDFMKRFDEYQAAMDDYRRSYTVNDGVLTAIAHEYGEDVACTLDDGLNATVAGITASLVYHFKAGRLDRIDAKFHREDYVQVGEAIIAKYGKAAKVSRAEFRNAAGAILNGEECEWDGPQSSIAISEYFANLTKSELVIFSPLTALEHQAQVQKKANADF